MCTRETARKFLFWSCAAVDVVACVRSHLSGLCLCASVHKVPATEMEALGTSLMGFFQKRKFRNCLVYIAKHSYSDPKTWEGACLSCDPLLLRGCGLIFSCVRCAVGMNLRTTTARQFFDYFGLDASSIDFAGHAMALQSDESYLDRPAAETVEGIKLYAQSLERYGRSPFLYPEYGLGGLPEAFSRWVAWLRLPRDTLRPSGSPWLACFCRFGCRLCAIHNGTFMLNAEAPEVVFDDAGVAIGVLAGFEGVRRVRASPCSRVSCAGFHSVGMHGVWVSLQAARARIIIGDPSYFPAEKSRRVGQVIRSICILDHPVAAVGSVPSAQIILPQNQTGRKSDIYVSIVSDVHEVTPKGKTVAIVSTTVRIS